MSHIALEVPPGFEHLATVRARVGEAVGAAQALKEERLQDLRLAVSEATTNAIEAHQAAQVQAPIKIRLTVADTEVRVVITDQGQGFDPSKLKPHPPVTDPERLEYERGLGVTLMRTLTDQCLIDSGPRGTTVTLVMRR